MANSCGTEVDCSTYTIIVGLMNQIIPLTFTCVDIELYTRVRKIYIDSKSTGGIINIGQSSVLTMIPGTHFISCADCVDHAQIKCNISNVSKILKRVCTLLQQCANEQVDYKRADSVAVRDLLSTINKFLSKKFVGRLKLFNEMIKSPELLTNLNLIKM
jgi:hypothetical protein